MTLFFTILKLLLVVGIVATIHEMGHFLFAKLFKMKVDEFGIGFGKAIFKKEYKGTIYSIRWIPLGGFVSIDGEDGESEDVNSFSKKSPIKRIIVLVMGATFNAILAFAIFMGVNLQTDTYTTRIKAFNPESILQISGLQVDDKIIKIGNTKTNVYQDILLFKNNTKTDIEIEYLRNGKSQKTIIKDAVKDKGYAGIYFNTNKVNPNGEILAEVEVTDPGLPASKVGIKTGDIITEINGDKINTSAEVIKFTSENPEKELNFIVSRGENKIEVKLTPKNVKSVNFGIKEVSVVETTIKQAYYKSMSTIKQIVGSYVQLFQGQVGVKQLSGIVGIGEVISRADGITEFIKLLGIISLAIGVANLLPFTPLDGGKVVLVLVEIITRKKVPPKLDRVLNYMGFALLIMLTIYVTINDIIRLI